MGIFILVRGWKLIGNRLKLQEREGNVMKIGVIGSRGNGRKRWPAVGGGEGSHCAGRQFARNFSILSRSRNAIGAEETDIYGAVDGADVVLAGDGLFPLRSTVPGRFVQSDLRMISS